MVPENVIFLFRRVGYSDVSDDGMVFSMAIILDFGDKIIMLASQQQ